MAIRSAVLLGAKQVIAIDFLPERLSMAAAAGAITINPDEESVKDRLNELTDKKGPDKCIDAVGMESHSQILPEHLYDRTKQSLMLETDRPHTLREAMLMVRPGGVLSVPGVYGGVLDKLPFGAVMNKGITIRTGQTHVNRWTDELIELIDEGALDPSFVITHTEPLSKGPEMYPKFESRKDNCIKVVLKPGQEVA
jgi:threonine dehydrogenase-like Zn-dependent dehydrogenase